MTDFVGIT